MDPAHDFSRIHTLSEVFSTITGGKGGMARMDPDQAALVVRSLADRLRWVSLDKAEHLAAIDQARRFGVRGGLIHDWLHASAAVLHDATRICTLNVSNFKHFSLEMPIEAP